MDHIMSHRISIPLYDHILYEIIGLAIYRYLSCPPVELDTPSAISIVDDDRYDDTLASDIRIPGKYDTILCDLDLSWSTPL